jgi:glycosyltransferase involved in cell wall biosynthesis
MNILFVNSIAPTIWGGMEEWIRLVASGLTNKGHRCFVCGRPNSVFLETIGREHPEITRFPVHMRADFSPFAIARIRKIIVQNQIDLVVTNFTKDLRLAGIAAKLAGNVPVIWSLGSNLAGSGVIHQWLTPRLTAHILVPSLALASEIGVHEYLNKAKFQITPIGLPDISTMDTIVSRLQIRRQFGIPDDAVVAVTSGRLVEQKGHDILLRAFVQIAGTHPGLLLLWLGDGPQRSELEQEIIRFNLSSRVILAGMRDHVPEILSACDFMIHPSRVEPYGIAILEGMRAGLPIIATQVGGIPEVTGSSAFALFPPDNDLALAHAMGTLASDMSLRADYGARSRKRYLDTLTYERMISDLEHYFAEVAGAH